MRSRAARAAAQAKNDETKRRVAALTEQREADEIAESGALLHTYGVIDDEGRLLPNDDSPEQ